MRTIIGKIRLKAQFLREQGRYLFIFKAYRSIFKAYWLFRRLFTGLDYFCRLIVFYIATIFKLPWSEAYFFLGSRFSKKLIQSINSENYDQDLVDKHYHRGVEYLERACQLRPNFVEAAQVMDSMALHLGRVDQWLKALGHVFEYQGNRAQSAGVDKDKYRFFDAGPIFSTIGNTLTLDAWTKSGILGFRPAWQSVILVDPRLKGRAANQCLLNYWKKYFDFVDDPAEIARLKPLAEDLRALHNYFIPLDRENTSYAPSAPAAVWIQTEWDKQGRQPLLKLRDDHRQQGIEMLAQMGIPDGAWFVSTHVREGGFKGRETFRDAEIETYIDSFKEVTSRGGWVIRMGDSTMTPLPPLERVIDYACSPFRSDWMDVFLLASARFMIGSSSGPSTVSYAFGVPVVMTNNLPSFATYLTNKDIFMPRLMRRIDDGRFLNLEELMSRPYSVGVWDSIYSNLFRVEVIANTPEEIAGAVREMIAKLDGSLAYTSEEESLQMKFKKLTKEREVMIGRPGLDIQCRLANDFLIRHRGLLG